MSHCPQCKKLMRRVCRYCQPQEYIDVVQKALMDLSGEITQRTWVGLTPEERDEINKQVYGAVPHYVAFHHAIEAKLREKNT